jgi:OFA family oxalate/formate antiporter-like MFS transporter
MLTAWGFAGAFGPTLIAYVRETIGHYSQALHVIAVIVLIGAAIPLMVHPPSVESPRLVKKSEAA